MLGVRGGSLLVRLTGEWSFFCGTRVGNVWDRCRGGMGVGILQASIMCSIYAHNHVRTC